MCCTRLAENTGRKKSTKILHLATIAQICGAIYSQLRHISTIRKILVKQQYLRQGKKQERRKKETGQKDNVLICYAGRP